MIRSALAVTALVALAALAGLRPGADASLPVAGSAAAVFTLARLDGGGGTLSDAGLGGQVALVNVWASWCVTCRKEHATLLSIAREGAVPVVGVSYRDSREDALRWLRRLGNPYAATGFDPDGSAAHELGVTGTPETYVVSRDGRIAYRHVGELTGAVWRDTLAPLVARLQRES